MCSSKLPVGLLLFALLLVSCKSAKMLVQRDAGVQLTAEQQLEAVVENTPVFDSFSSRLRMTIPLKGGGYTLSGTLKMQRNRLIQISLLLPIIRTEAARIEISPEHVLVIDRMNKRYAFVPISELRKVLHTEVDFLMLQALFSNTIFLPSGKGPEAGRPGFHAGSEAGWPMETDMLLLVHESAEFIYSFLTSMQTHRLMGSTIETYASHDVLQWKYANFVPVGETTFPSEMMITLGKKKNPGQATMQLSRLSIDKQMLTPTAIPTRYREIGLSDVLFEFMSF